MTGGRGGGASSGRARHRAALHGRDDELQVIGECLDWAARGSGGTLLLEGPPGMGKTRLLDEAGAMALQAGVRPLRGAGYDGRQTTPFAPLLEASAGSDPPIMAPDRARQLTETPYWMLHELQGALEAAASQSPLVVMLDDVQWADTATLMALGTLPSWLDGTAILWILTARRGEGRAHVQDALARMGRDGAHRLEIGPLSEEAVAAIVADRLAAPPDAPLLELAGQALGSPFLLLELLDGLREEGCLRTEQGRVVLVDERLPRRLTDSMRQRLDRLPDDTAQAVRVASVLGHRFRVAHLAAMLGRSPSALVVPVEEALSTDLLVAEGDQLRFRHDLLRQAVRETLRPSVLRALRGQAAAVMLESGAAAVEVAQYLGESAEIGDREAIARLREAARTLSASDAAVAADLSVRALELLPADDPDRGALAAETVMRLHSAQRPDDARALGRRALAGVRSPEEAAEVRLSLSKNLFRSSVDRLEHNRAALELPGLSPLMRARHQGWLSYNLAAAMRIGEAEAVAREAMRSAQRCDDLEALTSTTIALAVVEGTGGAFLAAARRLEALRPRVERSGDGEYAGLIEHHYVNVLTHLGRLDEAMAVLTHGVEKGQRERSTFWLGSWLRYGSLLRLAAGRIADARAEAESTDTPVSEAASGDMTSMAALLTLTDVGMRTGDAKLLKATADVAQRVPEDATPLLSRYGTWILAQVAIARDDLSGAAELLQADGLPYSAPFLPGDAGHPPIVARVALAVGDWALAGRAAAAAESFARQNPGVVTVSAIAAQTRGLVDGESAPIVEAAQRLRAGRQPLLFAAAAQDAADALVREGHVRAAVELLGEALEVSVECEAGADARRIGRRLRRHGIRRSLPPQERPTSDWAGLTTSELRVVRLVADGATNREAADRLYLSPHTVSSHLRHAFTKLGINSRIELVRLAALEQVPGEG
ncbi:MAG TPA: AAA family ATPase [Baekduia sp.]|jgi:DNA-binding CsgD family transcriptional regulator|nr:AAA family ATPase [Baekduia sp.]